MGMNSFSLRIRRWNGAEGFGWVFFGGTLSSHAPSFKTFKEIPQGPAGCHISQ